MMNRYTQALLAAVLLLPLVVNIQADVQGQSHFHWQHDGLDMLNRPTTITGFTLRCGETSGEYPYSYFVPDGAARTNPVSDVVADGDWYCAATATNEWGESPPSEEVRFLVVGGVKVRHPVPAAPYGLLVLAN